MGSFQAKIGWERMRKRKKKFIAPINSYPTRNRKFQRNCKKNSKNLKTPLQISIRSIPTQLVIEISKKIAKKFKKL